MLACMHTGRALPSASNIEERLGARAGDAQRDVLLDEISMVGQELGGCGLAQDIVGSRQQCEKEENEEWRAMGMLLKYLN